MGALCLVIVMLFSNLCPFSFAITLVGKESASCFTLNAFLMVCDCLCSVALPHGAMGWTAICDCGNF